MYIFIRKFTKVRSVADAARRAKSGIGQILRESHGFRSYYVLDGGEGVGVAVMIFEDRESAIAANDKVLEFVQASLHDLNLGDPEIIAGEVLVNIEFCCVIARKGSATCASMASRGGQFEFIDFTPTYTGGLTTASSRPSFRSRRKM